MALSEQEQKVLHGDLMKLGLHAGFQGDRLDAFRAGLLLAAGQIAPLVEISKLPEPGKPVEKGE